MRVYSVCAHHLLPVFGLAQGAYLPGERLVGLPTLGRLLEQFARRGLPGATVAVRGQFRGRARQRDL